MNIFYPIWFSSIIVLIILSSTEACSQDLYEKLEGEWKYSGDIDCPDYILLHSSGRFIIYNDCGSDPRFPIIEKGNWKINKQQNQLKLTDRDFVSPTSIFSEYHGEGDELKFTIENVSEKEMSLCFYKDTNDCVPERYVKFENYTEIVETFRGIGSDTVKMSLPTPMSLLTLNYHSPEGLDQIIIQDQDGIKLFEIEPDDVSKESEFLLADLPNILDLKALIFRVRSSSTNSKWSFKAEVK